MKTWQQIVADAEAYKIAEYENIYLARGNDLTMYPWEFVSRIYSREYSDDIDFEADHPSGLTFRWDRYWKRNGGVDIGELSAILQLLNPEQKKLLRMVLKDKANIQEKQQHEHQLKANLFYRDVQSLRYL